MLVISFFTLSGFTSGSAHAQEYGEEKSISFSEERMFSNATIEDDFSDVVFVSTKEENRYMPNYYEIFELKINPVIENISGFIQAQAGMLMNEDNQDNINGHWATIYYAANSNKIAFSIISKADAQSKL